MKALITATIVMSLALVSCGESDDDDTNNNAPMNEQMESADAGPGTILDIAAGNENFSTLAALVGQAGLAETLASEGPFTVFAPTDEAFAALDEATLAAVGNDTRLLQEVLLYHVVAAKVPASTAVTLSEADMANGGSVALGVMDGSLYLNSTVKVIATDIEASNGVIHVIDGVLLP